MVLAHTTDEENQLMRALARSSTLALTIVALTAAVTTQAAGAQPPSPGQPHVSLPEGRIFYTNPGTDSTAPNAGFPALFNASVTNPDGSRTSRLFTSYGVGTDTPGTNATAIRTSTDDGATWSPVTLPSKWAGVANAVRLSDAAGTVVAIDFEPITFSRSAPDPDPSTPYNENDRVFGRWTFNGTTMTPAGTATTSYPGSPPTLWARFQRGILLLPDSRTLLATVYGATASGPFTALMRSTDQGASWVQVTRLAEGAGWSEANVAPTSDGKLMAWVRRDVTVAGEDRYLPDLYYTQSSTEDGSGAWSTPVKMAADTGNSPGSVLLGNGAALQGSGRPGNVVRYKYSGTSGWQDWTGRTTIYANQPTAGTGTGGRSLAASGSSNTLALAPLTANTVLAVGDNCASWGCPASASGYPHGTSQSLWKSVLEVNTGQWGTIDLQTKYRRGEIAFVDPAFTTYGDGRTSIGAYAFDGDVRTDSSVVTANRSVTLRLDHAYALTGLGLHAHLTGPLGLSVETSLDGVTWSAPAQGNRSGTLHPLSAPTTARYLRLSDPNPPTGDGSSFLTELQLYSTLDGFEANVPGAAPVGNGLSAATDAVVVAGAPAVDPISARFLRITDTSDATLSRIAWNHGSSSTVDYEFKARASGTGTHGLLFSVLGTDSAGNAVTPYHFMLDAPSGKFYRYDFANKTWGAPLGTLAVASWSWNSVSVTTGPTSATLTVNGRPVATVAPSQPFSALTGNQLTSTGTKAVGDDWFVDDVGYTQP
ncbi:sialidase family protein [Amycolatopsis lexingtonensis]|uniref:sialidase family protein n=1 Tax=Amycolatopsis lexingtonensis TaxID=218822 RepID=UPI003F72992F